MDFIEYKLKVPSELLLFLEKSDEKAEIQRYAMLLYPYIHNQTISPGRAAEILGMNKYELINVYEDLGLPYYSIDFSEVEEEIKEFHSLEADLLW